MLKISAAPHCGILDRLLRLDLRAPRAGLVHELAVYTIGGVVRLSDILL
ncbi:MAG: hypothetical protein AAF530_04585 [Pseudomonadota bacterium]